MKKLIFLLVLLDICGKAVVAQNKSITKPSATPVDIYVGGFYEAPGSRNAVATYWKNGTPVTLGDNNTESEVLSMFVAGDQVFATGTYGAKAVYWLNGQKNVLTADEGCFGSAVDIVVVGNDVYIAGYERVYTGYGKMYSSFKDYARLWKNGRSIPLDISGDFRSYATCVTVDPETGDVYVLGHTGYEAGQARIWRNGLLVNLLKTESFFPVKMRIIGNELLVAGKQSVTPDEIRGAYLRGNKYDQKLTRLNTGRGNGTATDIVVANKNVAVVTFDQDFIRYWKNDIPTILGKATSFPDPYMIAANGDDVYVAGFGFDNEQSGSSRVWKNGEVIFKLSGMVLLTLFVLPQKSTSSDSRKQAVTVKPQTLVATKPASPTVIGLTLKQEAEKFLAENKTKPGVLTTPSGLQYEILGQGAGPKPGANDKVRFIATRTDMVGAQVKGSMKLSPNGMVVSNLMPGLAEGMQLMNVGGKYKFTLPPKLNMLVSPPDYPEGAVNMIWEVELLDIVR